MAAVTVHSDFEAQENGLSLFSFFLLSSCHEVMGPNAMIFIFWMLTFKPAFSLSSFTFIKRCISFLHTSLLHTHIYPSLWKEIARSRTNRIYKSEDRKSQNQRKVHIEESPIYERHQSQQMVWYMKKDS